MAAVAIIPARGGSKRILPRGHVQDIDTEEDWTVAEQRYVLLHSAREGS